MIGNAESGSPYVISISKIEYDDDLDLVTHPSREFVRVASFEDAIEIAEKSRAEFAEKEEDVFVSIVNLATIDNYRCSHDEPTPPSKREQAYMAAQDKQYQSWLKESVLAKQGCAQQSNHRFDAPDKEQRAILITSNKKPS
jgi:hypothetical protein